MKATIRSIASATSRFLEVPCADPDEARRKKLLNVLLVVASAAWCTGMLTVAKFGWGAIGLIAVPIVFAMNRYGSGRVASSLFLTLIHMALLTIDTADELANGRSSSAFAIPIVFSSAILHPAASFVVAGIDSAIVTAIALRTGTTPNPFAIITFFVIAAASWLAARSLERAVKEQRTINLKLDRHVIERTRQLAERTDELAAALAENQAILDSTIDGIIVFDGQGRAMIANPAAVDILGCPEHEIIGRDIETLMGEDVSQDDQELIHSLLQGQEMPGPSIQFDWGKKTLLASVAPVRLDSGREIGSVLVFCDFTHEAEIDRMKSAFVSIASHDLRTPLGAISTYAKILKRGRCGSLSDDQREIVDGIVSASEEMRCLAENLLDKAQIEAGSFTLHVESFSPADLVAGLRDVFSPMVEAKGLEFITRIEDDVPAALRGDRQRIHQVLLNLLGNGVKFTSQGGVSLHISRPDADHWALAVSDTGSGIPEQEYESIFEPFRRADDAGKWRGTGLGLSIVKQLVERMEGRIELESTVGEGSTFTIVLPLID